MFTGIISDLGEIVEISKNGDTRFVIATSYDLDSVAIGASIACNGVCLTVVEKAANRFAVDVSEESLSKTTMRNWQPGQRINLERALKMGDELGGHIVSGHVDGVVEVADIRPEGDSLRYSFAVPQELAPFVAPKGSVALDGVSLTVNEVTDKANRNTAIFGVNIIAHTQSVTTFGSYRPGMLVNMEIDMLARYVARLLQKD